MQKTMFHRADCGIEARAEDNKVFVTGEAYSNIKLDFVIRPYPAELSPEETARAAASFIMITAVCQSRFVVEIISLTAGLQRKQEAQR